MDVSIAYRVPSVTIYKKSRPIIMSGKRQGAAIFYYSDPFLPVKFVLLFFSLFAVEYINAVYGGFFHGSEKAKRASPMKHFNDRGGGAKLSLITEGGGR